MVRVRDQIRVSSMKGPPRDGVVTGLTGSLLRVRWTSGEETTFIPAPGTLTVLAGANAGPQTASKTKPAARKAAWAKKSTASKSGKAKKQARKQTKPAKRPQR
jgi:hypothetical protein